MNIQSPGANAPHLPPERNRDLMGARARFFSYPPTIAALVIGTLLSILVAQESMKGEQKYLENQFRRLAEDRISVIQNYMDFNLTVLYPVKSFFDSSENVERGEFRQFTSYLLERYPVIHAFEWVPRVDKSQTALLAANAAGSGVSDFRITENGGPPADRLEYYPVFYVEPIEKNESALGLNHAADSETWRAMQKSRNLRTLITTRPMKLDRFKSGYPDSYGVIAFLPVYRKGEQVPSAEERRQHLVGFVASVFNAGQMLETVLRLQTPLAMDIYVYADTLEEENALVYAFPPESAPSIPLRSRTDGSLEAVGSLEVGGHIWHVICRSTPDFSQRRERWESKLVLFIGLLLTVVFAYYLYSFERRKVQRAFAELSITDDLTGLYNRRGFLVLAEQQRKLALRLRKGFHLLYADLDGLKKINDTYGHAEGDDAIREAASVLRESFRESDLVARIGGDEYAVLAFETGAEMSGILHAHLERKISERRIDRPHGYRFSISIGSAFFDPEKPVSIDELMRRADQNLYEKKKSRR